MEIALHKCGASWNVNICLKMPYGGSNFWVSVANDLAKKKTAKIVKVFREKKMER